MNFRKLVTLGMTLSVLGANIATPAVYAAEQNETPVIESVVETEEVAIEDEATPLAGEVTEEEVDVQEPETTEENDEVAAESNATEEVSDEEVSDEEEDAEVVSDEAVDTDKEDTEKVEIENLEQDECNHIDADEDGICDECGEELETKDAEETAKKIKAGTVVSVRYHLNDDNTVIKITKTSATDDNGNTTVEETEEELGFIDEDGNLHITHTEINEVDICHVNISYDKEIEIVDNFIPTGEFVDTNLVANFDIESGSTITEEALEENEDAVSILAGINLPENLESGIDVTAHIDADGNVSEITAVATDAEHQEIEVEVSEIVEIDFEFDVEYSDDVLEETAEEVTIEDEETALAGDTKDESEEAAEDEESDTETDEDSEVAEEVADVIKEDEIVTDEPSDEVAEEVTTEEIVEEVIDVAIDEAPVEEAPAESAPADNSSDDVSDVE